MDHPDHMDFPNQMDKKDHVEVLDLDKNMKSWGWFTEDIQKVTKSMEFQEFFILPGKVKWI